MNLTINDDYFGDLLPYIRDERITDITWNGRDLWIDHLDRGRYREKLKLTDQFLSVFSTRIANLANKNFNMSEPLLEAETDDLRISIINDNVTNTDMSVAIRKTPAIRRLTDQIMLDTNYAQQDVIDLLEVFVKSRCSFIVTGDVGSGKTELVKYLTKYIPNYERAISIEDNFELRLAAINPELDCVEIKVSNTFNYQKAIKSALRQLCTWLLLSEARSTEVVSLLEAASTGCSIMTTIHSDDVRKLPDRVVNMMGIAGEEKSNDIYNFFDVAIKVNIDKSFNKITRQIDQIGIFDRYKGVNSTYLIYNEGHFTGEKIPINIINKMKLSQCRKVRKFLPDSMLRDL